ncbi:MAG TPA: IscS subfamily cysteine desulfurase [Kiloniellales bacterium]|nr:IscS subfamily cysteine desulfurase [Kiloniellales bacterium]
MSEAQQEMTTGKDATPIYFDYQATTPCDPRVVETMLPFFHEKFGNPHSVHHRYGHNAESAVETARGHIAELIGAEPREIVFTSGATESNNLAVKGAARFHKPRKPHVIVSAIEHKCVLECARRLESEGVSVTWLPVQADGLVDPEALAAAITEKTALVSIMAVNNEIGVIQPLAEIGALCRERGVLFHSDAAQAVGKIPLDVEAMKIDLLSLSGHKIYGPMGIGALYVRRRPRARIEPLFDGGGQERGLRSGTLPTPLCVGLGEACALAKDEMAAEAERLSALRHRLLSGVTGRLEGVRLNGDATRRIPGNLNLSFEGVDGEALIEEMPEIAVSSGSACTSASVEPSYVLRALGLDDRLARASIRIGLGRFTREADVEAAIEAIVGAVGRLRAKASRAAE